jgi:hypothetical protein
MIGRLQVGAALLLVGFPGCSEFSQQTGQSADPRPVEVLSAHWQALKRRDWRAAYERIHPDLKAAGLTLKRFTALHARRLERKGFPEDIRIVGLEQADDDVVVSFDVLHAPSEGAEPIAASPRRKVTLRKSDGRWALTTHDLLAVGPSIPRGER